MRAVRRPVPRTIRFPMYGQDVTLSNAHAFTPTTSLFYKCPSETTLPDLALEFAPVPPLADILHAPNVFIKQLCIGNPFYAAQCRRPKTLAKAQHDPYAAAYVDMFASALLGTLPYFPKFYGAYVGHADKYFLNVTWDYSDMSLQVPLHIDTPDEKIALLKNIPSAIIVMEKLEGSLASLAEEIDDPQQWASWLFQIAFALKDAQARFSFMHGDLHSNNVMWRRTTATHFTYHVHGVTYRVPTFGYQMKIIDFGRSYLRYNGRTVMSRDLHAREEAAGMVNWGPLMDPTKPPLPPNPSFDLALLATSLIEFIPDDDGVANLMDSWMTMDDGRDVMDFEDEGFAMNERIAQHCHRSVPKDVLRDPLFHQFCVS